MPPPIASVRQIMTPEAFHNGGPGSFEGWYIKLVSADQTARLALIPGLFHHADGSGEAFVQVLDGVTGRSWYLTYPMSDFSAASDRFDVRVGPNHFHAGGIDVDLPEAGLSGRVAITSELDPWPVRPWSPGVMGWYAWVPFMECYHAVCSFGHALAGELRFDGTTLDFDGGRGYIEKDWGEAFPAGYLWLHSNHFARHDASLVASVALIPWRGREFRGFIVGLREGGRLHRFATYNGAHSEDLTVDDDGLTWTLRSARRPGRPSLTLELAAKRGLGGLLHAPIRVEMHKRVEETLSGTVAVTLRRGEEVLFEDTATSAALEIHGDVPRLLATTEKRRG